VRLRQIKLAGFKSFVDPTAIEVPGNLAGVVGPNGCGKSNVIDAVRWVLGESKAAELRGESMQDVIFNGSANRKPAGRASVELVFDNAAGRIGGEWGKYTEISVKRVLTRDGSSSYYINNQTVRRRDVHDMFLGTGLGARAYAIIGQGMITRIIEARPDELRVFLEEAAGVSRYKERRRETENRLADTRENLTRVDDILRELTTQTERLEQQAEVAARHRELTARHDEQQQLLWLVRKRDAAAEQERVGRDIANRQTALEAHIADLRGAELALEQMRSAHFAANEAVHAAQGGIFEVNANVGKLEAEIRGIVDSRARLATTIETLIETRGRRETEGDALRARSGELDRRVDELAEEISVASKNSSAHDANLPQLEERYGVARDAMTAAQAEVALAEQSIKSVGVEQSALDRQLVSLQQRRDRLEEERTQLGAPDEARLASLQADVARLDQELALVAGRAALAESNASELQAKRQSQVDARTRESETLARLQARQTALRDLQANVEADERLDPWLRKQGLDQLPRLFKRLRVDTGWEAAIEAVLRERVHSLEVGRLETLAGLATDAPPARVAFHSSSAVPGAVGAAPAGFEPLSSRVGGHDAAFAAVIGDWLAGIFIAGDLAQALAARDRLPPGGQFIVAAGHRVSRHGVQFYAPDNRRAGLLARRQELENLEREIRAQQLLSEDAADALARTEAELGVAQADSRSERQRADELRARLHAVQLEAVRLGELVERVRHRSGQIGNEMAEVVTEQAELDASRAALEARFEASDRLFADRQQAHEAARTAYEKIAAHLNAARDEQQRLTGERQRLEFEQGATRARNDDVANAIAAAVQEIARLAADVAKAESERAILDESAQRSGLERLLAMRATAEERMREARSRADDLAQQLKAADERRLTLERDIEPKRERITEQQLKEQAARLTAEQFAQQLAEAGADEIGLGEKLTGSMRAPALQTEITRLAEEIAALGAVNLAALDELVASRTRKEFLDAQSADLQTAMSTLQDAIRRIDRETRELLQQTFDQVNLHFGQLFPRLFGGGEAKLMMTGDEILDAGVQVMAQPPGKRNSTIHLLSGGEKALAATALVFALFTLNPAPFCLLDEVDAALDDANTERFCALVRSMTGGASGHADSGTQFVFITHNKIAMEMAQQLIGVTMQEQGVSRIVAVDVDSAARLAEAA